MFLSIQVRAQRLSLSRSHLLWQGVSSVSCPQSSPTRGNNVNRHPFRLILRFHWSSTKLIDWFGAPSKQCWWGTWNSNELFIQVPIQNSTESDDTFPSLHPHEVSSLTYSRSSMMTESSKPTKPVPRFDLCVEIEFDGFVCGVKICQGLICVIFCVKICESLKVDLLQWDGENAQIGKGGGEEKKNIRQRGETK